jgi:hypothetical protein
VFAILTDEPVFRLVAVQITTKRLGIVGWEQIGRHHGSMIFSDHPTIDQSDIGGLVRTIIALWPVVKVRS